MYLSKKKTSCTVQLYLFVRWIMMLLMKLDNDADQEIGDKRIVVISDVEDQINTSAKFCKLFDFQCKPKGWLVSMQWKLWAEMSVLKFLD